MKNKQTVQNIYGAFGRGDIPAILESLDKNIEWEYGMARNDVPWLQPRKGLDGAGKFFESLGLTEISHFVPKMILAEGNTVIALVDITFTVKKTGKKVVEIDEAHVWHFNEAGKVVRFRHCADTHQHVNACRG